MASMRSPIIARWASDRDDVDLKNSQEQGMEECIACGAQRLAFLKSFLLPWIWMPVAVIDRYQRPSGQAFKAIEFEPWPTPASVFKPKSSETYR